MRNKLYILFFLLLVFASGNMHARVNNIDSLKIELKKAIEDTSKIKILTLIAVGYLDAQDYEKAIGNCQTAIEIASGKEDSRDIIRAYYWMGIAYYRKGNVNDALTYYLKALAIAKNLKNNYQSDILNDIAVLYKGRGEYLKAIEYFQQNLEYAEQIKDSMMIGRTLNNMANVYYSYGIYQKSIEYYEKSIPIFHEIGKEMYVAFLNLNVGLSYKKLNQRAKTLESFNKSKELFTRLNFKSGIAQVNGELGTYYAEQGNYAMALRYQEQSLAVYKALGEKMLIAYSYQAIGEVYQKSGAASTALTFYEKSLILFKELNAKKEMLDNYQNIASIYSVLGEYKKAYENFKVYSNLKDSTLSDDFLKQMQEMEAKYESAKKETEIKLQKAEISKKDSEAKRKNIFMIAIGLVALMVIGFAILIFKQYSEKKKANILLAQQNDEIKKQRDQIFQQKKEITDSIHYASRIQRAVLPSSKLLDDAEIKHFILYKPRDIVSGDFYWINEKDNKLIVAAADCTGHGVPGAFMSMLGMAFLNEIVTKAEFSNAADILNQLRALVVKSLHQSGKQEETKDGMDIALCMIDKENWNVQFAGAFNSMYLVRGSEIIEGPADRMPVGFHDRLDVPFTNTEIPMQAGDTLYIFSDGYVDQFGGENGKKFMAKRFKQLLVDIQDKPMDNQRDILDTNIVDWRGELDQVDDILVIGMRV